MGTDDPAPIRDGLPLPGRTVPDVVSQLCFRVLGPFDNRARSVLDWAGLGGERPGSLTQTAGRFGVTDRAVGQRVQRVAAAGVRLPLAADVERDLARPSRSGEDNLARTRWAHLLGRADGADRTATRSRPMSRASGA